MKVKILALSVLTIFVFGALPVFAQDSPPALPSLPPDEPTSTDSSTTDTTTTDTSTTETTTSTAAGTTSGPVETVAIIALALLAVYGIKKYSDAKKYQL